MIKFPTVDVGYNNSSFMWSRAADVVSATLSGTPRQMLHEIFSRVQSFQAEISFSNFPLALLMCKSRGLTLTDIVVCLKKYCQFKSNLYEMYFFSF